LERHFWSSFVRPNVPKSLDKPSFLLGQTSQRVVSPTRHRAPSVSSTSSSRSRPAPAKSILSSRSSIRTRMGRSPPSVKFLDMPTIHYEDEDEDFGDLDQSNCNPKTPNKKWTWTFLKQLVSSPRKPAAPPPPERPTISGPIPLWETAHIVRRSLDDRRPSGANLRSVRSNASIRSTRSTQSRLQTYWGRLGGRDP